MEIDIEAFEYAIQKIDDGFIFEKFGHQFLSAVLGYDFIPVGRVKDKGVDGLQYLSERKDTEKFIYQLSTEKDFEGKIQETITKLKDNGIDYTRITYVTNRNLNNIDKVIDSILENEGVALSVYDIKWFVSNAAHNEKTISAYRIFVDTYLHEYTKPGKYQTIANLDQDARLYVFLGQQFDNNRTDLQLDDLLADSLILYSLEETDPDKELFKTKEEIKNAIKKYLKFDPKLLDSKIDERLQVLSTKPRKINYHSNRSSYCLPFETRSEISDRNLKDEHLFNSFYKDTKITISKYFQDVDVKVRDIEDLIRRVFNKIFQKQGLEFSSFVLHGDSQSVIEQNLNDVIGIAVDESHVVIKNKEDVKTAIHLAIRDIVYNGSIEQRRFLKSL